MLQLKYFSDDAGAGGWFDICLDGTGDALESAVILSLFLDRRAQADDDLPAGADPRGFWGDSYEDDQVTGSKLWLIQRAKITPERLRDIKAWTRQALQWLLDDGVASAVNVQVGRVDTFEVRLTVTVDRPVGGTYQRTWDNLTFLTGS